MRVARRSNADNLSLTSSTSLDDSCDSYSTDTEGRCPHPLRSGSSNNRATVKRSQSKPLSSSLLMQQATYKIMQRRNGEGTKAGRNGRAAETAKIVASYGVEADGDLDRAENQQRSLNPNNKQQARIPSTVFKYMFKCDGSGKRAQSTASARNAAVDADAATVSAGVSAYDATAATDSAKREGEPAIETPRHNGAIEEAPKPRQKTAVGVGAKKSTKKRHDIRPSKSSRNEIESLAKPLETSALLPRPPGSPPKAAVRPATARTRREKAMARMPRAKDERSQEVDEQPQRTERAGGVSRNSNESEESAASPTNVLVSKWKLQRRMIAARRNNLQSIGPRANSVSPATPFRSSFTRTTTTSPPRTSCREFGDGIDTR